MRAAGTVAATSGADEPWVPLLEQATVEPAQFTEVTGDRNLVPTKR